MSAASTDFLEGLAVPEGLAEALRSVELIDHHVHGTFVDAIDRAQFEQAINEGSPDPIPAFMTQFDSQLGFAIRRWCAPVIGLPANASADEYWQARADIAPRALDRVMFSGAGVRRWIVDSGFSPGAITTPEVLASESGAPSSEILRLELVAEARLIDGTAASFADDVRAALRSAGVAGFKTICAYRTGFDIDWTRPSDAEVAEAVKRWTASDPSRLDDPVLESFLVHEAAELGLPVQFHVGFGDRDLDLHRTNPMLLLPLLRQNSMAAVSITLLHCYPYHREAGYLSQAFDTVYSDVGLSLNYLGAQSRQLIAESLEVAPFAKLLYSSDAYGLPELHRLGSILWRRGMAQVLGEWVRQGDWSEADAVRVVTMIGHDNAARVYEQR